MIRKQKQLLIVIFSLILMPVLFEIRFDKATDITYAQSCTSSSRLGWYPPTYSYNSSFLSLYGKTQTCWSGSYSQQGYSYGSQYPGQPLSKIKSLVQGWEEANGYMCANSYQILDSGWKYN